MASAVPDNRIREIRMMRELSLKDLAERCNTTLSTIQKLEKGEVRLSLEWMRQIGRALNVAPSDLLLDEDRRPYLTGAETRILEAFRHAPDENRRVIVYLVEALERPVPEDVIKSLAS